MDDTKAQCRWTEDPDDGYWETNCGNHFEFIDGGPKENSMRFCCYCGAELNVLPVFVD